MGGFGGSSGYGGYGGSGRVLTETGPLGSVARQEIYTGNPPGLLVASDHVEIVWIDNATYMIARVGFDGVPLGPPVSTMRIDNASYFLPRAMVPGSTEYIDLTASVASEGGSTFYLWHHSRQWYVGRTYRSEDDLNFRRDGPGVSTIRTLFSTEDTWWTGKPLVAPLAVLLASGAVGLTIGAWRALRSRRPDRS